MHSEDDKSIPSIPAVAAIAIVTEHLKDSPTVTVTTTHDAPATTSSVVYYAPPLETAVHVMSKKAKVLQTSLGARGVDWRKLKQGVNPLRVIGLEGPKDVGPSFLHLTVKMLLERGTFTTRELSQAFVLEFDWNVSTANSHVSIVNSLLTYVGAVTIQEGTMSRIAE